MADLPSGTVTFLFTDIEGSTQLWQQFPEAMPTALVRHNAILRQAVESHDGYVFQIVGDAVHAAFPTAFGGLNAAVRAQRALRQAPWEETGPIRVRMALHTGHANVDTADYTAGQYQSGLTLSRAARLLSAGHGGQVLLSAATYELVRDQLAPDVSLQDLGAQRLKDLIRPEHIFQALTPDLPSDFPPLKTLDTLPNNLPLQLTSFIGREREIAEVKRLLTMTRLLTLTGAGGSGKTRLALQVAADLLEQSEHGVWVVDLASLSDPALVVPTIAQTLGVREVQSRPLLALLKDYLHDKHLLLVLDNFEPVLSAAPTLSQLLASAPNLRVLVTSRALLRLQGERDYAVLPLQLPNPKQLPSLERLRQYEAVQLFIERAQAVRPDFAVTNENAPAVAEICYQLDGLPLAIELAAVRVRLLTPQKMLTQLGQRLRLLTGGARDVPARQQTLRATIDWSYGLLDDAEKLLFRRLAVFVGGCTLEAAEAVCNGDGDLDVLNGLQSLWDKSLLQQSESEGEPRFSMLETVREYALEKLTHSGEAAPVRQQHLVFLEKLAEDAEVKLRGAEQNLWFRRLETEGDNLRAAMGWATTNDAEGGLRLTGALWMYWYLHGHVTEGCAFLEALLNKGNRRTSLGRAKSLCGAGWLASEQGHSATAHSRIEESLAVFRELGNITDLALALVLLAFINMTENPERALALAEEGLSLSRQASRPWLIAMGLNCLGEIARWQQDYRPAIAWNEECLVMFRQAGDEMALLWPLQNLAHLVLSQGDSTRASMLFLEALSVGQKWRILPGIAYCLAGLAGVAAQQRQPLRAGRLYGAAEALFNILGQHLQPTDRADYERNLAAARTQIDEAAFNAAWAQGRAMNMAQAIAEAQPGTPSARPITTTSSSEHPNPAGLIEREV